MYTVQIYSIQGNYMLILLLGNEIKIRMEFGNLFRPTVGCWLLSLFLRSEEAECV